MDAATFYPPSCTGWHNVQKRLRCTFGGRYSTDWYFRGSGSWNDSLGGTVTCNDPHKIGLDEVKKLIENLSAKYERESGLNRELVEKQLLALPGKLHEELMEHFTINGVAPINMADLKSAIAENNRQMMDRIEELFGAQRGSTIPEGNGQQDGELGREMVIEGGFQRFTWQSDDKFHMVPEGFTFPNVDVKTMWNLWHFGNTWKRIQPYRSLIRYKKDDLTTRKCQTTFSKAKMIMEKMDEIISEQNLLPSNTSKVGMLDQVAANEVFEKTLPVLIEKLYGTGKRPANCKRDHEVKCTTLAEKSYRTAKRRRTQQANFNTTTGWSRGHNVWEQSTNQNTAQFRDVESFDNVLAAATQHS